MMTVTVKARKSAMGPAYMIPSIPAKRGKMRIRGRRKRICLVRDRKVPLLGFPMEVKKLELTGCKKFTKVKNRKM